jgi:hypothetical protein
MVSRLPVSIRVLIPMRADASAASAPACPAPTTMISNSLIIFYYQISHPFKKGSDGIYPFIFILPTNWAALGFSGNYYPFFIDFILTGILVLGM